MINNPRFIFDFATGKFSLLLPTMVAYELILVDKDNKPLLIMDSSLARLVNLWIDIKSRHIEFEQNIGRSRTWKKRIFSLWQFVVLAVLCLTNKTASIFMGIPLNAVTIAGGIIGMLALWNIIRYKYWDRYSFRESLSDSLKMHGLKKKIVERFGPNCEPLPTIMIEGSSLN